MTPPRIIVLEGPDGAGKTWLANALAGERGYRIVHFGPPGGVDPLDQYLAAIWEVVSTATPTVFDRLHLGERIYGPIIRGTDRLGKVGQRMIERVLLGLGTLEVRCLPPYSVAQVNWELRHRQDQELVQGQQAYDQVYRAYKHLESDLPAVVYDYTVNRLVDILDAYNATYVKNEGPGVGSFTPGNILLVGEQVNTNVSPYPWPFVAGSGSAVWLTDLLEQWGVRERDLYWVNAVDLDGLWTDPAFVQWLEPKFIVTLGGVAREWATKHKLSAINVPHPAFWKRFRAGQPYPLEEVFGE